jgi:hypothetical protein
MKKRRISIIIFVSIILVLCVIFLKEDRDISIKQKNAIDLAMAETVIKDHFKWWNEKNINKLNNTVTRDLTGISWGFENIDYVKLININEELSSNVRDGYIKNGKGKYIQPKDVKVFTVQYEIKLKDSNKGPTPSGKHEKYYIVIKQDENSTWLINEMGQ